MPFLPIRTSRLFPWLVLGVAALAAPRDASAQMPVAPSVHIDSAKLPDSHAAHPRAEAARMQRTVHQR